MPLTMTIYSIRSEGPKSNTGEAKAFRKAWRKSLTFFFGLAYCRNGVGPGDPYINGFGTGGMKGSSSEQYLTRIAEPHHHHHGQSQEDFGLANGLNDLSNVVSETTVFS